MLVWRLNQSMLLRPRYCQVFITSVADWIGGRKEKEREKEKKIVDRVTAVQIPRNPILICSHCAASWHGETVRGGTQQKHCSWKLSIYHLSHASICETKEALSRVQFFVPRQLAVSRQNDDATSRD